MALPTNNFIPSLLPNISFGPVIMEDMPYANMAQAPYPPLVDLIGDKLATTAQETLEALTQPSSLTDFISYMQWSTLGALP